MRDRVYLQANGITLNALLSGSPNGIPLVFINSLGSDLRSWDSVISILGHSDIAKTHRIVCYDKRGHGLSDCPPPPYTMRDHTADLAGLIDVLECDQVILVGISIGGMIAIDYASLNPQKVKALILCDTAPQIGTTEGWNERIQTLREHGMAHLADAILGRWFAPDFIQKNPIAVNIYRNMLVRTPVEGYTGSCEAIRDADFSDQLAQIDKPVLVMCGEEDLATTPDDCRRLSVVLSNARFEIIHGAGHLPCIEKPKIFTSLLSAFLQSLISSMCYD